MEQARNEAAVAKLEAAAMLEQAAYTIQKLERLYYDAQLLPDNQLECLRILKQTQESAAKLRQLPD